MHQFLVFNLCAPLAAFGEACGNELRPTELIPTRSMVLGLVAAAQGIDRHDDQRLRALSERFSVAVLERLPGRRSTDFHTMQAPAGARDKTYWPTRRSQMLHPEVNAIITRREYLNDVSFIVVLWSRDLTAETYAEIVTALREPQYALFAGRMACPLSAMLDPQVIAADGVLAAVRTYAAGHPQGGMTADRLLLAWEPAMPAGHEAEETHTRHDLLVSGSRRTFRSRLEHRALVSLKADHVAA